MRPVHLGLVLFHGCMPAGLFAASDMARACNLRAGREHFRITWVGADLEAIPTWQGPVLQPEATMAASNCDVWLIPGLWVTSAEELEVALEAQQPLIKALSALPRTAQLWSYCAGVPLVAAAGRLARRSATATWWLQTVLERRFRQVHWHFDELLVHDVNVVTAAGPNGYLPLMLHELSRRLTESALRDVQEVLTLPRPHARHGVFRVADLMALRDPQMQRLALFAQRTPASEASLQRAAAHMHVSVRTLCRHVRRSTGLPAGEWLRRIKLRQVGEALTRTRRSIKCVSEELGYASQASLHRAFRQMTGWTPAGFRQRYSELSDG